MRLIATPDAGVTAIDRAIWLTWPFDFAWPPPDTRGWLALTDAAVTALALSDAVVTGITLSEAVVTGLAIADEGDT